MLDEMQDRYAEKELRRTRMRSIILLSLIAHLSVAIVYLFLPLGDIAEQQADALAFDLFKEHDPLLERKLRPKPPLTKKRLDPNQKLAKDALQKKIDAAKNERDEVVKLSERVVIHDVEVNNAPINELVPDLMTDAKLREADASNLSKLIAQPGRTDGMGLVTGRVRARGDGFGKYRGSSQGGGGDGLLEGGGSSGYKDPLGMIKFLNDLDGPQNVVYCLDITASMSAAGLRKLELAKDALKDSVLMLGSDDNFNIVPFHKEAQMMSEKLLPADEKSIKHALYYIDTFTRSSIINNRGTNILAAIKKALTFDTSVIVLITDGVPQSYDDPEIETDTESILDYVKEHNVKNARFYVVGLEVDPQRSHGAHLLNSLAYDYNGEIRTVSSEELLKLNKQSTSTEQSTATE